MKRQKPSSAHLKSKGSNKKRIVIGVTGCFGSGKSTVAGILKSFGAKVIDADRIAHEVLEPEGKIYKKLISAFGKRILKQGKNIDRDRLAKSVFADKNLLHKLNRIMHPEIIRIIRQQIRSSSKRLVVLDAPLLIEKGLSKLTDKLIVVKISRAQQLRRILKKNSMLTKTDISRRIRAQMPLREKLRFADFIIDNNGNIKQTRNRLEKIRRQLWQI
jgi:dephospho-CoA kinase